MLMHQTIANYGSCSHGNRVKFPIRLLLRLVQCTNMAAMRSGEKPPILDVTVTMLEPLNKEMVAMLVSQTNPQGIEFHSFANFRFCFG